MKFKAYVFETVDLSASLLVLMIVWLSELLEFDELIRGGNLNLPIDHPNRGIW